MCQVHFIRAVLKRIPRKDHKSIVAILKDSLSDPRRLQECVVELESRGFSRAADTVERFQFDLMNCRYFPSEHWRRIRTTNLLERVHKELKRRYRSIGAFPNDPSLLRIVGSILIDINEEWITSRRYLSDAGEIPSADTGAEITAY
jgi:transposase-like protein